MKYPASVARMKRSGMRGFTGHSMIPDFASLHPGYSLLATRFSGNWSKGSYAE